jgi:hypothetical protein
VVRYAEPTATGHGRRVTAGREEGTMATRTMLGAGAMIMAGAWFAYRALRRKAVLIPTALLRLGCLGVGVFPLTHPGLHTLSARRTAAPFRHLWTVLGAVALGATVLGVAFASWGPVAKLGQGGLGA